MKFQRRTRSVLCFKIFLIIHWVTPIIWTRNSLNDPERLIPVISERTKWCSFSCSIHFCPSTLGVTHYMFGPRLRLWGHVWTSDLITSRGLKLLFVDEIQTATTKTISFGERLFIWCPALIDTIINLFNRFSSSCCGLMIHTVQSTNWLLGNWS